MAGNKHSKQAGGFLTIDATRDWRQKIVEQNKSGVFQGINKITVERPLKEWIKQPGQCMYWPGIFNVPNPLALPVVQKELWRGVEKPSI